ncbi:MAG: efflux RND transporter periplasmic adaptor subunit [candidate division WOR-3 bacterium]|nr:efflux RND transporter periplasmic adaptor subunit [candidate division WOR-3 bacterium]MDW7988109.1 efflux RND transporter periplasmic adaptor subunit [candidate division WOR-3 bacterium]
MKKKPIIIAGIVIIVVTLIIVLNIVYHDQKILVEVKKVNWGCLTSKVSGSGELRAQKQVNIQAQVMAVVEKIYVSEGMHVKQGDLICVLDQKNALANLELAQAQFDQAELAFVRSESLFLANLISRLEYENSLINYRIAKARLEQAQDAFQKTKITAPVSGVVTKINIKEGETAIVGTFNNPGTVLMVIADLTKMIAAINLDETEVPLVKPDFEATVYIDAFPNSQFSGRVTKISYLPKEQTLLNQSTTATSAEFEVEIVLDSTPKLARPGMSVNAEIITSKKDSILIIPIQAVGKRKIKGVETQSVFVVEEGIVRLKPIKTGIASETDIEVIDGLKPGDLVVIGPYKTLTLLKDGDRVKYQQ